MKHRFLAISTSIIFATATMLAGTGDAVFNKIVSTYKSAKGIAVNFAISSTDGNYSGQIIMQGNKFRMATSDLLCWYDGKTQWSYSTMSGEVSIMQPTAEELQVVNPFSIISNFQTAYTATLQKSGSEDVVLLQPKDKKRQSNIKSVKLSASKKTHLPSSIEFIMTDGTKMTIKLSQYQTGANFPTSTFVYNKKLVPPGTPTVDLR